MNVTSTHASTTAVSCLVATLLSESLPNDGEKLNQPKRPCLRNAIMAIKLIDEACMQFSTQ